jgi:hypothetical protein
MQEEREKGQEDETEDRDVGYAPGSASGGYRDYIPSPSNSYPDESLNIQSFAYCDEHNQRYPAGENCPKCPR